MLRFLDSGESHGKELTAIIDGFPSNVPIDINNINKEIEYRMMGYGRGLRMGIEKDFVEIKSGVRGGKTLGSPITLSIHNLDYKNFSDVMDMEKEYDNKIIVPRPGHADLNGALKYNFNDIRNVIERASARETAIRTAVGAFCMELLKIFDVKIVNRTISIGNIFDNDEVNMQDDRVLKKIMSSNVFCYDNEKEKDMINAIDDAKQNGDTLGGCCQISAFNIPAGLGSYSFYDRRADYRIGGALMSVQGVKSIEFGEGISASKSKGSMMDDEISIKNGIYNRLTNNAGGIEGGITNGMPIVAKVYMKPIPTIKKEIQTVDLYGNKVKDRYERSDTCAVPALGVICKNVMSYELCRLFLEKFSGDCLEDIKVSYDNYLRRVKRN